MFVLCYKPGTKKYCYNNQEKKWLLVDISGRFVSFAVVENYDMTTADLSGAMVYHDEDRIGSYFHDCDVVPVNISVR